jgi:hypothetical protein
MCTKKKEREGRDRRGVDVSKVGNGLSLSPMMRRQELGIQYTGVRIRVKVVSPVEIGRGPLGATGRAEERKLHRG